MRLYGNDIDETTTALEADLGWIVGWQKDGFDNTIGAAALQRAEGRTVCAGRSSGSRWSSPASRARVTACASAMTTPPARVTSGTQTPYLKKAIGMAYLPVEHARPGAEFDIDIRGRRARAQVVPMPFYRRPA